MTVRQFVRRDVELGLRAIDDAEHEGFCLAVGRGGELNRCAIAGGRALGMGETAGAAVQRIGKVSDGRRDSAEAVARAVVQDDVAGDPGQDENEDQLHAGLPTKPDFSEKAYGAPQPSWAPAQPASRSRAPVRAATHARLTERGGRSARADLRSGQSILLLRINLPLRQMRRNVKNNCVRGRPSWITYSRLSCRLAATVFRLRLVHQCARPSPAYRIVMWDTSWCCSRERCDRHLESAHSYLIFGSLISGSWRFR